MSVVIVAGGTGGLGSAVCGAFVREGAVVITTYRSPEEFEHLRSMLAENRSRVEGEQLDVTDEQDALRLVDRVLSRHARIDGLVNAVGGYAGDTTLWKLERNVLDQMMALNVRSFYALARAVVPVLLKQSHGSIVNVVSKAALDHRANESAYAASKAAALAMTDCLAAELTGTGVRVNSVLPSIIDTAANRRAMPKADFGKWPKPEDIAAVIAFLCSDAAKVIHGAAVPVYGGL
jgi:NAD(P)-dependent dehydrogenase (short-subunit alcohol dehydrogenase family)